MKRRGPGRPRLAKGEGKDFVFSFRISAEERRSVEIAASASGLTTAGFARAALLDAAAEAVNHASRPPPPRESKNL